MAYVYFWRKLAASTTNKSGIVKEAARNLTNRSLRIHQHLSNSWEHWLNNWNWIPWVLHFLGPLLLLAFILTFSPCLMLIFPKFLQDHLWAFTNQTIYELLLTHSNYQKLWPHTNPLDLHFGLFFSHSCNATVLQETVTEDWTLALILNQKVCEIGPIWGFIVKMAHYVDLTNKEWSHSDLWDWSHCPSDILFSCWHLFSQGYVTTRFQTSVYVTARLQLQAKN